MADKIDSNVTGLSFAEEASLGVLPGSPVWHALEPNSYSDFGGQIKTVARNPINQTRQRKKGVITDLDASGGFNQDLTFANTIRILQGFMFANIREKKTTKPLNSAAIPVTGVTAADDTFAAASGLSGFLANQLVLASGFGVPANNGLKVVASASTATAVVVGDGLVDEASPPADAALQAVGYQFASATLNVVMSGNICTLSRASGTFDLTTLGLLPGEWIFVGGDNASLRFANNQGWARVKSVTATLITLDKTSWTGGNETGTGKTIQIFFGDILRNEPAAADIVRRTYQLERTLGEDDDGTMSEYLVGAVANEMTINIPMADKVMLDMSFVAIDNEQYTGLEGTKSGTRVPVVEEDAYNTSVDVRRVKLYQSDDTNSAPAPLFAFATELSLMVKNNASPNKAIGVLGSFEVTTGTFEVGGSLTVYFANIEAVQAVRNNADITLDICLVKDNKGLLIDVPLIALGDGRLSVEQDQPITLPLETMAAQHGTLGYTLLIGRFSYLPDLAS
jgi:hypothetical protein